MPATGRPIAAVLQPAGLGQVGGYGRKAPGGVFVNDFHSGDQAAAAHLANQGWSLKRARLPWKYSPTLAARQNRVVALVYFQCLQRGGAGQRVAGVGIAMAETPTSALGSTIAS